MKKFTLILFLFLNTYHSFCYCQKDINEEDWTENEKKYYSTLEALAQYVTGRKQSEISKDTLFSKYIYFDNVLYDGDKARRERRLAEFDTIFSHIPRTIDSLGLENLDAKPLRFYRKNKIFKPFHKALSGIAKDVMVYYKKDNPNKPLGTLLFEEDSKKLIAWILLQQGDNSWFYLTFNLL